MSDEATSRDAPNPEHGEVVASSGPLPGEPPAPAQAGEEVAGFDADRVDLLAASLRADSADLSSYAKVLLGALSEALPGELLEIERVRSLRERLSGGQGRVVALRAHIGEVTLELTEQRRGLSAVVARNVRGVSISRREVSIEEWADQLARALASFAATSAKARAALGRLLGAE